jgi:hypothetical protein
VKNILLLIFSITISLAMAESALRLAGFGPRVLTPNPFFVENAESTWSVPDRELGWINKEGVSVSIEYGAAEMTFWSDGRRAVRPDASLPPSPKLSVMVVGGSNAQSYGVTDEESFVYKLGQRFPDVWFENFGNGGYSTAQAMALTQRVIDRFYAAGEPDLILLTFADSHAARNVSDQSWVYSISDSEGRYISPPHYRLTGDGLLYVPFRTIAPWPLEARSAALTALHNVWMQSVLYNTTDQAVPVTRQLIQQFAELAAARGSAFVVAVLEDYSQIAGSLFDGVPVETIECSGLQRTAPDEYLLGGAGHPNAKLHDHFAKCVGSWLDDFITRHSVSQP